MNESMHLFAGAGGGLLGDLILGHKPIIAVEWDKYACKVLRQRAAEGWFPDLSVWEGDVRLFDPSEYAGKVDCIHAGFPCQDISNAGKQAGVGEGTRSGLYREVLRIAGVVRPRELFLENVSAILSNGLGTVLGDLSALGYSARWICLRASDVGANHGRDRWWLLAKRSELSSHTKHDRDGWGEQFSQGIEEKAGELAHPELCRRIHGQAEIEPTERGFDAQCQSISSGEDVAYASSIGQSGQRQYERCLNPEADYDRQTDRVINGCQGIKGWWELEPDVDRVVDGVASRVDRLKAIGNGQVPLQAAVAYSILRELMCPA